MAVKCLSIRCLRNRLYVVLPVLGLFFYGCTSVKAKDEQTPFKESTAAKYTWPAYTDKLPEVEFSLDTLQHRSFNYFWELADAYGQIPDRWPTERFSSVAATGFGLPVIAIGAERGWITREQAAERVLLTLQNLWDLPQGESPSGVAGYKGLFYHFLDHQHATRYRDVELSTIDSGLLLAGVLAVGEYFDGDTSDEQAIRDLADKLYRRVEWDFAWMDDGSLSMGWRPDRGFIPARWRGYNEASVLLILAMGSPTHPIPDTAWQAWTRTYDWGKGYGSEEHVMFDPLFGHQYSQMFIDFRGIQDEYMREKGIDYFENSVRATKLQHAYAKLPSNSWKGYGESMWGLTACDGPGGKMKGPNGDSLEVRTYWARGVDGQTVNDDGTLAPTAAGGSIAFTPEASEKALNQMWTAYQPWLVGRYGLRDAFNLNSSPRKDQPGAPGWFDVDYLGIDQGPIVIQIENARSGFVWNLLKTNPHVIAGLKRAGFTGGWLNEKSEKK